MKKNLFLLTLILFISSIAWVSCDDGEESLSFLNQNYKSTVIYPNGKQFSMTTQFQNNDRYKITIQVPVDAAVGEEKEYITRIEGKFEVIEDGKNRVVIKLSESVFIYRGYTGGDSYSPEDNYLSNIFPTIFTLKNKKLTSNDSERTKIVITAQ